MVRRKRANRLGRTSITRRASASNSKPMIKSSAKRVTKHRPCIRGCTSLTNHSSKTRCRNTFDTMGESSPPTKLQTFFFGITIARIRIDPKHNIDVIPGHLHAFDHRPDEVALARPVGRLQAVVELGRKIFEASNNELQFPLHGGLICQGLALLFQPGQALAQAGNPRLKLGLVNEALRITVDQPGHALASLAD